MKRRRRVKRRMARAFGVLLLPVLGALVCAWYVSEANLEQRERKYLAEIARYRDAPAVSALEVTPAVSDKPAGLFEEWIRRFRARLDAMDMYLAPDARGGLPAADPGDEATCAKLREILGPHSDILEVLRQEAPALRTYVEEHGRAGDDTDMLRRCLCDMRRSLGYAVSVALCDEDPRRAVRYALAWFAMGGDDHTLAQESSSLASLAAYHLHGDTMDRATVMAFVSALRQWRPERDLTKATLERLDKGLEVYDAVCDGAKAWPGILGHPFGSSSYGRLLEHTVVARHLAARERVRFLAFMARMTAAAREPAHVFFDHVMASCEAEDPDPPYLQLARYDLSFCASVLARGEARRDLAVLGLLVEHYHGEQGAYPPDLATLGARYGIDVPADACSGAPYQYTASDDGFLLYSRGVDGEDSEDGVDDIVWRGNGAASTSLSLGGHL